MVSFISVATDSSRTKSRSSRSETESRHSTRQDTYASPETETRRLGGTNYATHSTGSLSERQHEEAKV